VDLAREVAVEAAEDADAVGEHLGTKDDGDRLVTHTFATHLPGYRGWVWAVTLSRAPRGKEPAIVEAALVPADDALLAPAWVPWAERVQPGDLDASMVLPLVRDDVRLVPGFEATVDEDAMQIWELGLGRERVLGPEGRDDVATRWYRGSHGPTAASAIASAAPCQICAFFVPLTGALRMTFGACTNEWSPSDGKVVSVDHGCGAHSQTDIDHGSSQWPESDPVFESEVAVPLDMSPEPDAASDAEPESDTMPGSDAEPESDDRSPSHE
jgi:hypothetical protein